MKPHRLSALFAALALIAGPLAAGEIPERPEALEFPPLEYQPPEPEEFRVELATGPVAYIVPDPTLPLVNIQVLIRTGEYLDPDAHEGLAELTGYLMTRGGVPSATAEELDERIAFLAAQLSSSISGFQGTVSLNLLSKDLDEGLGILREVLSAPKFSQDKLDLRKEQLLQAMKQRNDDSSDIESRERRILAYGEDFWSNRFPTEGSLNNIDRDDLIAFHRRWVHPKNFVFAVSGDFETADMKRRLEELTADWPHDDGETPPPVPGDAELAAAGVYIVDKEVNQGRVTLMLPGIQRDDPDYFACLVMNDILGGGGFTSRLMNRIRSDEGLAYGAGSAFQAGVYAPGPFLAAFQSKSRTVAYATSIIAEELERIKAAPVSDEELQTARRSFIDTFPENFASKAAVASIFASDEFTGRYATNPDYWATWRDNIEAVTPERILEVAHKYLDESRATILIVGDKDEILEGHPDHAVDLNALSAGPVMELPLRDPLTMKPEGEPVVLIK